MSAQSAVRLPPRPRAAAADMVSAHFGGPDQGPGALRDLLEDRIHAVPPGGAIDWATYYFRDEKLADALIRAHRRGVAVRVCLEGRPRNARANDAVIRRLGDPRFGIGDGLTVIQHILPLHLHLKLYCFSGPRPAALLGSFNPSGNAVEDTAILNDIGDQDRGHNLLVEFTDREIVSALVERIASLQRSRGSVFVASETMQTPDGDRETEFYFTPFYRQNPLRTKLAELRRGSRLRIAASHLRDPTVARCLADLAAGGVEVLVLTGATKRRSPSRITSYLAANGAKVFRFDDPDRLPMHCKFMLADGPGGGWAAFGSYNLTRTSRWLNQELLAFSSNSNVWQRLDARWFEILKSCSALTGK